MGSEKKNGLLPTWFDRFMWNAPWWLFGAVFLGALPGYLWWFFTRDAAAARLAARAGLCWSFAGLTAVAGTVLFCLPFYGLDTSERVPLSHRVGFAALGGLMWATAARALAAGVFGLGKLPAARVAMAFFAVGLVAGLLVQQRLVAWRNR